MNLSLLQTELLTNIYNIEIDKLSEMHVESLSQLLYMHLDRDYFDNHIPEDFKVSLEWDDKALGNATDHYAVSCDEDDPNELFRDVERHSSDMPDWHISIVQLGALSKVFVNCPDTTFPVQFAKKIIGWCLVHDLPYTVKYSNPDHF